MCRWKQTTESWLIRNVPLKIMATHLVVAKKMGCWMRWLACKYQWRDDDGESMKSQVSLMTSKWWEKLLDGAKMKYNGVTVSATFIYVWYGFFLFSHGFLGQSFWLCEVGPDASAWLHQTPLWSAPAATAFYFGACRASNFAGSPKSFRFCCPTLILITYWR